MEEYTMVQCFENIITSSKKQKGLKLELLMP